MDAQQGQPAPAGGMDAQSGMGDQKPVQSKVTMLVVCFFLGSFGIHRLMMGYGNWWLMLITLGGLGIWTLYDLIMIAMGNMKMADGRELS